MGPGFESQRGHAGRSGVALPAGNSHPPRYRSTAFLAADHAGGSNRAAGSTHGRHVEVSIQELIADYLRDLARWREQRAEEYDRDPRNLDSAAGLEELARYVLDLPDDDPRLTELARLAVHANRFEPGQQAHFAMARFRFHDSHSSFSAFLDRVVDLQRADTTEDGHFGGRLPDGDDPWARRPSSTT